MPKLLKNCLIVFARNPVLGKVKTRIAATQDIHKALQVYKTLLDYTLNMVAECNFIDTRLLCFAGGFPNQALPQPPFALAQQIPNPNLGARMQAAFEQAFAPNNQHQRVCIIGSDCPYLTPNHLQLAFKALLTHKAVIGPAADGGYYLLGINGSMPTEQLAILFNNIPWGTAVVFEQTLLRFKQLNIKPHHLPTLADIDTWDDWIQWTGNEKEEGA
ncbi:MAG: TIGR04282 family arsenosugar biosynthesis glycosyltransferase [Sphingobacteriales bacterium]|jgi:rSAM/selenodomain-associated transferase 1|nr:TIGR04282 family arsenosugar biosynthesis glycosyltransferase [Sphingobacteriales bacterium]MBP9141598.1 TIGR04282 family arsenosugar biosynthesis glycosyltransferase [Chitinophagales bacterium]MDA0198462.1 TIGR04282 family arsenosugar biosynthesis glycosyltransferase [Bacteroidota bacterium]MBK6890803.1 TIGR04282 family arsenosugar biosynthesis glycosyltransferase [Sphingobacteriales bacterium]MBK7526143.1 TIGR04282 family arsenosugar biosynthesis glycosyltransferase [Sphingobacteriales bac